MRDKRSASAVVMAFSVAAGFFTGCDKTPTTPTSRPEQDPPARVRAVLGVEVVGPEVVPLGETVQFRVMERLSDGSSRDLTDQVRYWRSDRLLKDSMPGLVTGVERGDARVIAVLDEYGSVSKDVTVLPAGTFKLQGTVIEAEVPSGRAIPVGGALVEVTSGVGARLTTHTDYFGTYRLYGVSGEIGLRVTSDGYRPAVRSTVVSDHRATYDIELPLVPRPDVPDVSGAYTLTIKAAETCGVGLGEGHVPEEARVRAYPADVRQNGSRVEVTLSGATLLRRVFVGRVDPGHVTFELGRYETGDFYQPYILERLPTLRRVLGVAGVVITTVSANQLNGALDAAFSIYETENPESPAIAWCHSERHQFVLSRWP